MNMTSSHCSTTVASDTTLAYLSADGVLQGSVTRTEEMEQDKLSAEWLVDGPDSLECSISLSLDPALDSDLLQQSVQHVFDLCPQRATSESVLSESHFKLKVQASIRQCHTGIQGLLCRQPFAALQFPAFVHYLAEVSSLVIVHIRPRISSSDPSLKLRPGSEFTPAILLSSEDCGASRE